jgi:hypothetical protein
MFKRRLIGRRNSAGATPPSLSLLKGPSSSELHSSSGVDSLSSAAGGGSGGGVSRASNSSTSSPSCLRKSPSSKTNCSSPTQVTKGSGCHSPQLSHRRNGNRRVRFRTVYIREYERIIGDNPSCSSGAPIRFVSFRKLWYLGWVWYLVVSV